jgi:hypothetical protein
MCLAEKVECDGLAAFDLDNVHEAFCPQEKFDLTSLLPSRRVLAVRRRGKQGGAAQARMSSQ